MARYDTGMVFSEGEYLDAIRECTPATTKCVADEVGVTRQGADYRLRVMEEKGLVTKQMVGNTLLWSVVEGAESPVSASDGSDDEYPTEEPAPAEFVRGRVEEDESEDVGERGEVDRDRLREELAGSGDLLERRVDEVLKMYDYLREHGEASKGELLGVVDVDATRYAGAESVWANMVKGKDTLRALPGVETPPTGRSEWRFREE